MSNLERQRAFCARNPGYYARLKRRRQPSMEAVAQAMLMAQAAGQLAAEQSAEAAPPAPQPDLPTDSQTAPTGC